MPKKWKRISRAIRNKHNRLVAHINKSDDEDKLLRIDELVIKRIGRAIAYNTDHVIIYGERHGRVKTL